MAQSCSGGMRACRGARCEGGRAARREERRIGCSSTLRPHPPRWICRPRIKRSSGAARVTVRSSTKRASWIHGEKGEVNDHAGCELSTPSALMDALQSPSPSIRGGASGWRGVRRHTPNLHLEGPRLPSLRRSLQPLLPSRVILPPLPLLLINCWFMLVLERRATWYVHMHSVFEQCPYAFYR